MASTEKNANTFDMTSLSAVNSGYSLMLINNSTNEGQLITMTDLATMILNEIRNQTFTAAELGQSTAATLVGAISGLNSAIALSDFISSGITVRSGFEYVSGGYMPLGKLYFVDFSVTVTSNISASSNYVSVAGYFAPKAPAASSHLFATCSAKPNLKIGAYVTTSRNLRIYPFDGLSEGDIIRMTGWYMHS